MSESLPKRLPGPAGSTPADDAIVSAEMPTRVPAAPTGRVPKQVTTIPPPSSSQGGVFAQPPPAVATQPASHPTRHDPPQLAGYEILGELGRGGMGVVYQARQVSLNRLVALKMVLAGTHAGPGELARFRHEAEAVARLQHPNIVQIYEVGEHEGRPYFSLEYVDGSSLDRRIHGSPQAPRAAAAVVQTLARAVHATHQKGIIHRDLKPSNVLITPDNTLKITDFGIAKRFDREESAPVGGETPTGTPSYMAPEQAAGKQPIGPAVDVYALGAILYELLTGQPPFRAETLLDTLNQVMTLAPLPPSKLQPKVPRDLEIICLKCLHKEPLHRYASAEVLADELQHFLKGEPIAARPVGALVRGWRWCRRRPKVATLLGTVVFLVATGLPLVTLLWARAEENRRQAEELRALAEDNRQRAEANFDLARRAVNRFLREANDDPTLGEPVRRKLLESVREFYEEFLRERGEDPRIRQDLAATCSRLAQLYDAAGDTAKADEARRRAAALAEPRLR